MDIMANIINHIMEGVCHPMDITTVQIIYKFTF
jgi:hypothetical protein